MTTLTTDALPVALMQTATTLPAVVFGLPAGSLADRFDRRRLLLVTNLWMLLTAATLAGLTLLGVINPALLLMLTFAIGIGSALNSPTWSSVIPEVVSRAQLSTAVSFNGLGYNVARTVGPAIGGNLVAVFGPAGAFVANAVSYVVPLGVLSTWRPPPMPQRSGPREGFFHAMLTGLRYAGSEQRQRVVLTRSLLWMLGASSLWSLLPLVARNELALDAPGYGFLVTCVGGGAVLGAFALPALRQRWSPNVLLVVAVFVFSSMLLTLAWVRLLPVVWLMLAVAGAAWTQSNQNFQIAIQLSAPGFLRARAIASYLLTFQGGQAFGSALWGGVAERVGNPVALTVAAGAVMLGLVAAARWPVEDLRTAESA